MKKYILILMIVSVLLAVPPLASAQEISAETLLAQINNLFLLIQNLQAQIVALKLETASQPPAPAAATTSIAILSPNDGESFVQGQSIRISWSGGEGNVQIGLVDSKYETDNTILGWISLNAKPDSSLVWNGEKVSDITGTVSMPVSSTSAGPFKIIAVSDGLGKDICALPGESCNYDLSNAYFTVAFPALSNALSTSCSAAVGSVSAGAVATWKSAAANGEPPYTYRWSGTDGISALPTRFSSDGKFLDVIYNSVGLKTAGVTVRDAVGRESSSSCSQSVTVTPAASSLTLISPNGGESFVMAKTIDPSQFVKVSWRMSRIFGLRDEKIQIALQDALGRDCIIGSASNKDSEALVGFVDGHFCQRGIWALSQGPYRVKIYLEGKEDIASDISDSYITLTAPVTDVQVVIPSASVINSGESVSFRFLAPANAVRASLYLSCPRGVAADPPNACNKYTDITQSIASSTGFTATFSNSSSARQTVRANFYVYLPNNPNYARGVPTQIAVNPESAGAGASISVVSPNGGEKVYYGAPYSYRFTANRLGTVDLTLVPYPPVDAGMVCNIASGISAGAGELVLAIPEMNPCARGPARAVAGNYKLLATLKDGEVNLASDLSDSPFTVSASSTAPQ